MWAGVPEWRLPRDVIMDEVSLITDLGIEIRYNTEVGRDVMLADLADELRRGHHLRRLPDSAGTRRSRRAPGRRRLRPPVPGGRQPRPEGCLGRQEGRHRRRWFHLDGLRAHRAAHGVRGVDHDLPPLDPGDPGRCHRAGRSRARRRRDHVHGGPDPRHRRRQRPRGRHRVGAQRAGRAGRQGPPPPATGRGLGVRHPLRHGAGGHRPAAGQLACSTASRSRRTAAACPSWTRI